MDSGAPQPIAQPMVRGSPIEGTLYATTAPVQDVGVDGRPDVFVAEEFLDGADVVADLEQVSREAVPQRMNCGVLGDPGGSCGELEFALDDGLVHVVAAPLPGDAVDVVAAGGKDPLPGPVF